jgi:uncharacterized phage protein (TIGR02220 family)
MELLFVKSAIRKSIGVDKMARPKKQTVDYFPHIIKQGKTMTILESKFGNDGYAFWFKLLEILGSTEGHSYRYENPTDIEFLCAKTNVSREKAEEILNLLADLDAIDKKCWENNIIWSDNFIENVADVYSKRSCGVPQKPVFDTDNPNDKEFSNQKPESKEVSGDENPQSKLKESKLKESKEENHSPAEKKQDDTPDIPYSEIVEHLNERTGSRYRSSTKKTRRLIRARWNEGFRLDDFKTVIDKKCVEWMGDEKMEKYLRPPTLFGTKFESYLNQLSVKNTKKESKTAQLEELYQEALEEDEKNKEDDPI